MSYKSLIAVQNKMEGNKAFLIDFIKHTLPMPHSVAEKIAGHFEPEITARNERLLQQGEVSDELFILQTGLIRAYTLDISGDEVTTNFFAPGSLAFDIASFFKRTRSQQSIITLTDCTGWRANYSTIQMLFHSIPEFREFGRANLVNAYASLQERTLSMINLTAEQRYESLFASRPDIFHHAPLKYIASYLGVTDSSLSRIRKEFATR